MQNWLPIGLIFCPDGKNTFMKSHASLPFAEQIQEGIFRIYFSSRNQDNKSNLFFLDFNMKKKEIIFIQKEPLLKLGENGFFDSDGIMACHLINISNEKYIYYIGWNLSKSVPFRNAIGIAKFNEKELKKVFNGPILDRSPFDPCFVASCCTIKVENEFLMYYLSCINWIDELHEIKHSYNIKIAVSSDGLFWKPTGKIAIDFRFENEYAISVPRVIVEDDKFKMWYSYRGGQYSENYRIGYAESLNGLEWKRLDEEIKLNSSTIPWDSQMQCYPFIFDYNDNRYMLYNGNEYGKTGFGIAILEKKVNV